MDKLVVAESAAAQKKSENSEESKHLDKPAVEQFVERTFVRGYFDIGKEQTPEQFSSISSDDGTETYHSLEEEAVITDHDEVEEPSELNPSDITDPTSAVQDVKGVEANHERDSKEQYAEPSNIDVEFSVDSGYDDEKGVTSQEQNIMSVTEEVGRSLPRLIAEHAWPLETVEEEMSTSFSANISDDANGDDVGDLPKNTSSTDKYEETIFVDRNDLSEHVSSGSSTPDSMNTVEAEMMERLVTSTTHAEHSDGPPGHSVGKNSKRFSVYPTPDNMKTTETEKIARSVKDNVTSYVGPGMSVTQADRFDLPPGASFLKWGEGFRHDVSSAYTTPDIMKTVEAEMAAGFVENNMSSNMGLGMSITRAERCDLPPGTSFIKWGEVFSDKKTTEWRPDVPKPADPTMSTTSDNMSMVEAIMTGTSEKNNMKNNTGDTVIRPGLPITQAQRWEGLLGYSFNEMGEGFRDEQAIRDRPNVSKIAPKADITNDNTSTVEAEMTGGPFKNKETPHAEDMGGPEMKFGEFEDDAGPSGNNFGGWGEGFRTFTADGIHCNVMHEETDSHGKRFMAPGLCGAGTVPGAGLLAALGLGVTNTLEFHKLQMSLSERERENSAPGSDVPQDSSGVSLDVGETNIMNEMKLLEALMKSGSNLENHPEIGGNLKFSDQVQITLDYVRKAEEEEKKNGRDNPCFEGDNAHSITTCEEKACHGVSDGPTGEKDLETARTFQDLMNEIRVESEDCNPDNEEVTMMSLTEKGPVFMPGGKTSKVAFGRVVEEEPYIVDIGGTGKAHEKPRQGCCVICSLKVKKMVLTPKFIFLAFTFMFLTFCIIMRLVFNGPAHGHTHSPTPTIQ